MKNRFSTLIIGLTCSIYLGAQENQKCGTEVPSQQWEDEFQKLITDFKQKQQLNKPVQTTAYTIPVIFHVIHGGEPAGTFPNISQGQINSQITVLNQDCSGTGYNVGNYPTNAFANWAIAQGLPSANIDANGRVKIADFGIQFCLAEKDTLGNILQEPGIDRINFNTKGWSNPNTYTATTTLRTFMNGTVKPQSIWNPAKYLNIWVSDRNSAIMVTGFASMPPLSTLTGIADVGTDTTDGIWCYGKALGSYILCPSGTYAAPQVTGRTITHEVGHWLGLRHIWGDGSCASDYCNDTPPATTQNVGSPTYPLNAGSCSSPNNSPDGEMFMNFMDYSSDPNKYMFTVDQMTRALTAMANSPYRNQLGTHGLCSVITAVDKNSIVDNSLTLYPNPTSGTIHVSYENNQVESIKVYSSSGSLLFESLQPDLSVETLPAGIYFLVVRAQGSVVTTKVIKQ